jgi:hypothetical protein
VTIHDRIAQRRRQILVHSIIYYRFDDSIISDHKWVGWARELVELQAQYPEIAASCPLAEAFKDFNASTGYDLPLGDPHYGAVARWLLERRNQQYG